jgi:hypothetical protein
MGQWHAVANKYASESAAQKILGKEKVFSLMLRWASSDSDEASKAATAFLNGG